ALVRAMSSALVNRVTILHLRVDTAEWLAWAQRAGIRNEIRSFITAIPDALMRPVPAEPVPFSTPRAWALLSRAFDMAQRSGILNNQTRRALTVAGGRGGVLRACGRSDRCHPAARRLFLQARSPAGGRRRALVHPRLHPAVRA